MWPFTTAKKPAATTEVAAKLPEVNRPWEDITLSATERYTSYEKVLCEQVEGIFTSMTRAGITQAEQAAIRLNPETQHWVSELKQLLSETPEGFCSRLNLQIYGLAGVMVHSYTFDKKTGTSTFTLPAGVTEVEAIMAINEYFRKYHHSFKRDAVYAGGLEWFEELPQEFPKHCQERDYSQAREITVQGVVNGTQEQNRVTQEEVLREKSLLFSDPREQALAGALHACKHDGADLFQGISVRGSAPGSVMYTTLLYGIGVLECDVDFVNDDVAASGSPYPESK